MTVTISGETRPCSPVQGGFKNLLRQSNAVPEALDVDNVFLNHLGYTDPKKPRFELQFDHFLDACQAIANALCVALGSMMLSRMGLTKGNVSAA